MTDKTDLICEILEYVTAHGGENTATHLLVQAASAIQTQAAELEAVGAGGVQALSAAPAIKPLVWSDESGPTDKIRYNHITAETALGQFSVEWKGWKEEDGPCVYLAGDYIGVASDLGGAKMLAEQHIRELVANLLAASPTPPAEQQAQPGAVYAELPQPDSWFHFTAQFWENKLYDFADRTHALRKQAAPKAAPGEQNTVPAEWLEQAYREGWAACRDAETIGEEAEDWAFGNSTANSRMIDAQQAAPKQEAQEPVAWLNPWRADQVTTDYDAYGERGIPLYTAPRPAPAPLSDDVVKDALSAAPAIGDELRDTLVAVSAAMAEGDDRAAQKMICEILAASTTPPAEQQAQPGAVYAELPRAGAIGYASVVDVDRYAIHMAIGPHLPGVRDIALWTTDQLRDFADRTHALRIEQAAPKAAPGEPSDVEIDAFLDSPAGITWVIASNRERYRLLVRAVLAKWAAPQQEVQEQVTWESTTPGYIKYITQARYEKFSPAVRRWYKPYRCSGCSERGAVFDACDMATATPQPAPDCHHRPPCDECAALAAQRGNK